jgi:hypothetical protein
VADLSVEVHVELKMSSLAGAILMAGTVLAMSGCASGNAAGGDPGAIAMPAGSSCQTVRGELNKLDSKGTPSRVEQSTRGGKLAPAQQAEVDRYNYLLNLYLGARCHV